MAAPERYPLGIEELLAFAARAGVKTLRHATRREVALLARVAERDAPIVAAGSEDKKWVIFRLRLPAKIRDGAARAAEWNARGPFGWTYEVERDAVVVRAALPYGGVEYSDAGVAGALWALRDAAERAVKASR